MATKQAVASSLAMLSRAFAGVVDDERIRLYHAALDDIADEQLARATVRLIKTHPGEFIPTPAMIRRAAGADQPAVVDIDGLVREIEKLATYSPAVGMIYPPVPVVREKLGDAAAYAYTAAGGARRMFSDSEVSQDIARREFQKALEDVAKHPGATLPVLGAPRPMAQLGRGDE